MTFFLLLVCFFLSGFSALLYETAWSREFAFVFGTSELAVVAVLAAYMGGLALGAAVAARWAPRIRRPVLAYGVLELVIALWAIALPYAIRAVRAVYLGWLGGLDALPETLSVATHAFHLIGAFVVLVPCTALMGATLPLLARHAVTRDDQIGPRVGLLYGINTFGAIAGTLTAAFVLLPAVGLRDTVYAGAAVNALVFLAAAALARVAPSEAPMKAPERQGIPWILPVIAISGAVSFGYEVLWFRVLGQVIGGSTAAFSTMLASFLAGIALGSAIASRWAKSRATALFGFAVAQLATAFAARIGFAAADQIPAWAAQLGASVNALGPAALLSMGILMPLTLCVGATFPFAVRLLARDAAEASASSARVYAWNTVGSIVGAVGTGYALLPWLGLEGTLTLGVFASLGLALFSSLIEAPKQRVFAGLAIAGAFALLLFPPSRPDKLIRSSPLGSGYAGEFRHVAIGRSSTVALIDVGVAWRLTTNGLPESVITPDGYPRTLAAADWLSILPVLARPKTEHMVIIGLGGGMTLEAVPKSVDRVEVIELEPEVVTANLIARADAEYDPVLDPRVSMRLSDARGALILAEEEYGAIVSQPSHPWTSGASHLYTREFFELARSRLRDDGVFVQWIGAPFVDLERLRSLVKALNESFEHVALFRIMGSALVMIASQAPFDFVESAHIALEENRDDLYAKGVRNIESLLAFHVLDAEGTLAFADSAQPNTDDFNVLATAGLPSSGRDTGWVNRAFTDRDPLPAIASRLDLPNLAGALVSSGQTGRATDVASQLEAPDRDLFLGWVAIESNKGKRATRHLKAALEVDPELEAARIGLALVDDEMDLAALSDRARGVIRALREYRSDPKSLETAREVDALAAEWRPDEILFVEATELRARWRAEWGNEEELDEAAEMVSRMMVPRTSPRHLILSAKIHQKRGRPDLAWLALDGIAWSNHPDARIAAGRALPLALQLGEPPDPKILADLRAAAAGRRRGPGGMMRGMGMGMRPR